MEVCYEGACCLLMQHLMRSYSRGGRMPFGVLERGGVRLDDICCFFQMCSSMILVGSQWASTFLPYIGKIFSHIHHMKF